MKCWLAKRKQEVVLRLLRSESLEALRREGAYKAFDHCVKRFETKYPKAMVWKLMGTAQNKWQRLRGYKLLTDVVEGVKFKDGE